MVCKLPAPYYIPQTNTGLKLVNSKPDGYNVFISWHEAFKDLPDYSLAYNIYFSTERDNLFEEGPKLINTNLSGLGLILTGFSPGDTYYFAVRATEYDSIWYNPALFPDYDDSDGYTKIYPETLLLSDIGEDDLEIPIADIETFPAYGIIKIGAELIRYESKDIPNNTLIVSERGFLNTDIRSHDVNGIDGYFQWDPVVRFFVGYEEQNGVVRQEEIAFSEPNFAYTIPDGYRQRTQDLLNTDLSASDENRVDFRSYDYAGWHRTDPDILFKGECLDTYIGGEHFCADGYNGVGNQLRNISFAEENDRRQEFLLERTGEPVVLVKRLWKGITCKCYKHNKEYPENRCGYCYGTGIQGGYQQYYNSRRSDGRILARFGPVNDTLQMQDAGLESYIIHDCWSLVVPAIHAKDFIIRFNEDGTEEFRYEVLDVTRNKLLYGLSGKQNFKAQRVRKTDPIYQWRAFRNTATMPVEVNTTVGLLRGPNDVPIPHTHVIVLNENITDISQINQTTSVGANHSHSIINGVVQETLGHSHDIII